MILEIVSICISVTAVYFTYRGLEKVEEHNRKSVKPYLLIDTDIGQDEAFAEIYFVNKGVGPAIITDFKMKYKQHPIDAGDYINILNAIDEVSKKSILELGLKERQEVYRSAKQIDVNREALAVDEKMSFIRIEADNYKLIEKIISGFEITCEFKSIYEEKDKVFYESGIR